MRIKTPLPQEEIDSFVTWFSNQTRPAVRFERSPDTAIAPTGSRMGGPAWLADGECWPQTKAGVPLEFIFQLDCADCASLKNYPSDTILQFFVARDDVYGADFTALVKGDFLVHPRNRNDSGSLHAPPPLVVINEQLGSDFSPFWDDAVREYGQMMRGVPFTDKIDFSIDAVTKQIAALDEKYDTSEDVDWHASVPCDRRMVHHTGGYPAFVQADITAWRHARPYDHVLLHLTTDDALMWGDHGECVFLIRSADLAKGDFSRIAYSWDC